MSIDQLYVILALKNKKGQIEIIDHNDCVKSS